MEIHRKAKVRALSVALLVAFPTFGAEKIQITGSTTIELPKPSHILEDSKYNRNHEGPSGRSTFEGGMVPMMPANNNPQSDKKLKEAIDKKKNWIFVNPYEMQFDNKTEEFLKGEKGTGLYNHRLMSSEEKTVLDRFISEKKPEREAEGDQPEHGNRNERVDQKPDFLNNTKLEAAESEKEKPKLERGLSLPPTLAERTEVFTERSAFHRKLERNPFSETAGGSRSLERGGMSREDREARDAELSKIYQPRGIGGPVAAQIDPVNGAVDATRQEATPFSARRADPLLNIGRAEPGAAGRNSPIFSGPANSGISAGLPQRSSGFADFGSRAPVAAAPNASIAPAQVSTPTFRGAPFVLPKPQRKF